MRYFYFNPPVSVKLSESYRISLTPRTSMRSTRNLTAQNKRLENQVLPQMTIIDFQLTVKASANLD